jgi:hypothetical protein
VAGVLPDPHEDPGTSAGGASTTWRDTFSSTAAFLVQTYLDSYNFCKPVVPFSGQDIRSLGVLKDRGKSLTFPFFHLSYEKIERSNGKVNPLVPDGERRQLTNDRDRHVGSTLVNSSGLRCCQLPFPRLWVHVRVKPDKANSRSLHSLPAAVVFLSRRAAMSHVDPFKSEWPT